MRAVTAPFLAATLSFGLAAAVLAQETTSPATPPEDGAEVSDVVVRAPPREVPFPNVGEGAPALSADQMRVLLFEARMGGIFDPRVNNLTVAHTATQEAERIRREAVQGLRTQEEVEFAELRRQAAVRAAASPFYLRAPPVEDIVAPKLPATLEDAKVQMAEDTVGRLLVVSGALRNATDAKIASPSLLVTAVDQTGFILGERAMNPKFEVDPGQARRFVFFFRIPRIYLGEVRLVLVDPASPRLAVLAPEGLTDTVQLRRRTMGTRPGELAIPSIGEGAPAYSTEQVRRVKLAARDPALRREAEGLIRLIQDNGGTVAGEAELVAAERATEAARVARRQGIMGRRTQKQVEDAELARQAAVLAAFGPVRPAPDTLALAGADTPVLIEGLSADHVVLRSGHTKSVVGILGAVRNTGDREVTAPMLTVTALDARGFALERRTMDPQVSVGPGQSRAFRILVQDPPDQVAQIRVSPL